MSKRGLAHKTAADVSWAAAATIGGARGARAFPDVRPGALVELAPMLRRAAALDEKGRFAMKVSAHVLVFRLLSSDGSESYWVRNPPGRHKIL